MQLAANAPTVERYLSLGLSMTEAMELRDRYICRARTRKSKSQTNEILDLLDRWDVTTLEIGMLRFSPPVSLENNAVQIGQVEADPLIMTGKSEILVEEFGAAGHILWRVARTPEQLLDALVVAAKYLGSCGVGEIDIEESSMAKSVASNCAVLAGGDQYSSFFKMLLMAW